MNIKITHKISLDRVADLLCNALEGGSNYWYMIEKCKAPTFTWWGAHNDAKVKYSHLYPFQKGGSLTISDEVAHDNLKADKRVKRLTLSSLRRGLKLMAISHADHFADFMAEEDDGNTADVFLQLALFGEVIYG